MNKQMTMSLISDELRQAATPKKELLERMDRIIPWSRWTELVQPYYYKGEHGNKPYPLERMLRIYVIQNLYNLADMAAKNEIIDSRAFSDFCGVDSSNQVPDGDTIGRFRNILKANSLQDKLFDDVVRLLESEGLILHRGTIVDSTLIASPSSTKNKEKSRDPEAHQSKKGNQWHFGYKAHIGMTPESIIVSAAVSSGEVSDGDYMIPLVEQAKMNGLSVESVIGDTAYSGKENLDALKGNIDVVAPLNPVISQGNRQGNNGFHYNKDADSYVCPAGEISVRKEYRKSRQKKRDENGKVTRQYCNEHITYYFDVKKCKDCPLREGCYKGGKSKSYTVMILSDTHKDQIEFEKTPEFKQKMKMRKRIEPLNAHLKNDLGMKQNISYGIESMTIQTAVAIYMSNIQKIMKFEG